MLKKVMSKVQCSPSKDYHTLNAIWYTAKAEGLRTLTQVELPQLQLLTYLTPIMWPQSHCIIAWPQLVMKKHY